MRESLAESTRKVALENMQASWKPPAPPYWMIARYENRMLDPLVIVRGGGTRVLPIFSHEEEASSFLRSDASLSEAGADGWRVRQTGPGELLSILHGPCAEVKAISLGPSPELTVDLASICRDSFVDFLLGRGRSWFDDRRGEEKRAPESAVLSGSL